MGAYYDSLPLDSTGGNGASGSSSGGGPPSTDGGAPSTAGGVPLNPGPDPEPDPPRCTAPVSPITDFCASIPKLRDAVSLDGDVDCGLMPIDVEAQGWAYDPDQLDGTRQISIGRTRTDGTGLRGQLFAESVMGFPIDWTPERVSVQSSDEGYVVEAFIPGSVLDVPDWRLSAGDRVGMAMGINVSFPDPLTTGTQGHRWGQFFYYQNLAPGGEPYRNVTGFCTPVLVE